MLITEFLSALEAIVPLSAAGYARDAIGLQVGLPRSTELHAALFAYEVTREVIVEARERGANLIVAFHPLIFPSIDAITDATRTGELIRELIRNEIALYVQHTAFDTHPEFGTSRLMAEALSLRNIHILTPLEKKPDAGMGVIGNTEQPIAANELLSRVQTVFGTPSIRFSRNGTELLSTIAMVGGAGMEFYSAAVKSGAEAFITADVRYHDFYRASHDGILLLDAGHAETEKFVTLGMLRAAQKAVDKIQASEQNFSEGAERNLMDAAPNAVTLQDGLDTILLQARTEPNAVQYHHHVQT
ncbi:MAG TPA: Nif3-like dinuclear metal center hexameric protein [Candidatus Kapabacteria bacterium]|jgi:dinuclear metal center YbgI/SA1388 family protein